VGLDQECLKLLKPILNKAISLTCEHEEEGEEDAAEKAGETKWSDMVR